MWKPSRVVQNIIGLQNAGYATKVTSAAVTNPGGGLSIDAYNEAANSTVTFTNSDGGFSADVTVDGGVWAGGFLDDGGLVADAAAIPVTHSAAYEIVTGAAETNTLAAPSFCGQLLSLYCRTYAIGARVVTVTGATVNQTGNNRITFNATSDWILLVSIDVNGTLTWRVLSNDGALLTTV